MSHAVGLKLDHRPGADVFCRTLQNPREGGGSGLSSVYSLVEPPVCCVQLHLYTVLIGPGG